MFISRKIVYPVFIIVFAIIFFTLIYFISFTQVLTVENASLELVGDQVLLKADIVNNSNHSIDDAQVKVVMNNEERVAVVQSISANDRVEFTTEIPFSENLQYEVYITSSFNRPVHLHFELDETTVRPVTAEVQLTSSMTVGNKYDMIVRLCNVSESDLFEVYWIESVEGSYFEEPFFPRTVSLGVNDCKNLNSTLTPINPGMAKMKFVLRVGKLEQNYSHTITITS